MSLDLQMYTQSDNNNNNNNNNKNNNNNDDDEIIIIIELLEAFFDKIDLLGRIRLY